MPADVILGVRPDRSTSVPDELAQYDGHHGHRYESWSWTSTEPVARAAVDRFAASLPAEVLRVKGRILLDDRSWVLVQAAGRRIIVTPCAPADRSELVAIAVRRAAHEPGIPSPFVLHFG